MNEIVTIEGEKVASFSSDDGQVIGIYTLHNFIDLNDQNITYASVKEYQFEIDYNNFNYIRIENDYGIYSIISDNLVRWSMSLVESQYKLYSIDLQSHNLVSEHENVSIDHDSIDYDVEYGRESIALDMYAFRNDREPKHIFSKISSLESPWYLQPMYLIPNIGFFLTIFVLAFIFSKIGKSSHYIDVCIFDPEISLGST